MTVDDPQLDPGQHKPRELSWPEWKERFDPGLGRKPKRIRDGETIVLWYSTEVFREVELVDHRTVPDSDAHGERHLPPAGIVFLHGFFFAHDAEPDHWYEWFTRVFAKKVRGTTGPLYWPWSEENIEHEQKWLRSASARLTLGTTGVVSGGREPIRRASAPRADASS